MINKNDATEPSGEPKPPIGSIVTSNIKLGGSVTASVRPLAVMARMGYDLHITRRDFWADEADGVPITLDDWKRYIATDPEMRLDGYAEATTTSGDSVRMEMAGIAVWIKHSQNGIDGNMAWIYHSGDRIVAKNPDKEMIGKMCRIASHLNAKVQGDDGETYAEDGTIVDTDCSSVHSPSCAQDGQQTKPWWKFW